VVGKLYPTSMTRQGCHGGGVCRALSRGYGSPLTHLDEVGIQRRGEAVIHTGDAPTVVGAMLEPMLGIEEAERALELADLALARSDVDGVVAQLSAAIRGFTAADDSCRAAMACVRLGDTLANAMGNLTASRAWFARARRLVEHEPPCVEQGWVAVAAMGCDVDDPAELLAAAELALDRARRFGDVNLETKALADAGLAQVQAGRVAEGMSLLDEAMALACGPADDGDAAAKSVCSFFTACYYAADFERAGSWANLLRRHGLIAVERGGPVFLSSHCDSVQAALLVELGQWGEAEAVLARAIDDFEGAMQIPSWHPAIALADLRIRQGRFAEAEMLLVGKDQAMQALLPAARLHLARGDHDLARVTALRGLRVIGDDRLRAAELLSVLVDAELARGDLDAATKACAALIERTGDLDIAAVQARACAARARLLAASGELEGAAAVVEETIDRLDVRLHPWLRGSLLLELARLRERSGDRAAATLDAKAAAAILAPLDVLLAPTDAVVLERLAHGHPIEAQKTRTAALARDGKWWIASCEGTHARLQDTKGLRYLAELVARPGCERHALDLVDQVEGVAPAGEVDRRALGDAGEVLDSRARAAYRHRIEELRADADEALALGDLDAAEARQAELDQLVRQLARAFGLGGRHRRAASAAERARLNVTRALRAAIARLVEAIPGAGAVLDRRVRTGLYCAYEPADGDEFRWIVQS
jgi:tetratricopeptide (TPR) repeat protein